MLFWGLGFSVFGGFSRIGLGFKKFSNLWCSTEVF